LAAGNVPDGVAEELLHRHEEAWPEEAAEGGPATYERDARALL